MYYTITTMYYTIQVVLHYTVLYYTVYYTVLYINEYIKHRQQLSLTMTLGDIAVD